MKTTDRGCCRQQGMRFRAAIGRETCRSGPLAGGRAHRGAVDRRLHPNSRWGRGLSGAFERRIVRERVEASGCEDCFGLGVSVCLPGELAQLVGGEPEVVESFAGEMAVDDPVGRFG